MIDTKNTTIESYLENIINGPGGFKTYESREMAVFKDREIGIASFVIRCLANPTNELSEEVLKMIQERRNEVLGNKSDDSIDSISHSPSPKDVYDAGYNNGESDAAKHSWGTSTKKIEYEEWLKDELEYTHSGL